MEWRRVWDRVLCVLYPRRCAGCGCLLPSSEFFCDSCKREIEKAFSPRILERESREPGPGGDGDGGFSMVKGACFTYRGPLRRAVLAFKFRHGRLLDRELGGLLCQGFLRLFGEAGIDGLQPVPLYGKDQRRRGYNQAALLAEELSRRTGIPLVAVLEKSRRTPKQHHLDAGQRRMNLRGAFAVPEGRAAALRGRRILVVDDVTTTGSTLEECGRTLLDAGAAQVYGLVLAAAVKAGVDPDFRRAGARTDFADSGG